MSIVKFITDTDVKKVWNYEDGVKAIEQAFLASDLNIIPDRLFLQTPHGVSLFKPGYLAVDSVLGLKIVHVRQERTPSIPATILLFDEPSGSPSCLVEATFLTAARTAAMSVAASKKMLNVANNLSFNLLCFGAGMQAREHIVGLSSAFPLKRVVIVNRSRENAEKLVDDLKLTVEFCMKMQTETGESQDVTVENVKFCTIQSEDSESLIAAVREADIIVTTTPSVRALFDGSLVKETCHLIAVGSYSASMCELDADLVTSCSNNIVLDAMEAQNVGEFQHLSEKPRNLLSQLLAGTVKIDRSTRTLFKSVGTSIADLAAASYIQSKFD